MIEKIFGKWHIAELILYLSGLALIVIMSVCFGASWMSAITGLFGLSCVLFAAKGKVVGILFTWVMIVFLQHTFIQKQILRRSVYKRVYDVPYDDSISYRLD